MYTQIRSYCEDLMKEFDSIPQSRKYNLNKITEYIVARKQLDKSINLVYICTHNSRRSHFGQIWAHVSASFYKINDVHTFSGGTKATAFNANAINALKRVGFRVDQMTQGKNPTYRVFHDDFAQPSTCFSKVYDNSTNPSLGFAAIMTCSDAEENCPFIPGVELRIGTTYDDPKTFDNTPQQDSKYDERCRQIALETLYVFSNVD